MMRLFQLAAPLFFSWLCLVHPALAFTPPKSSATSGTRHHGLSPLVRGSPLVSMTSSSSSDATDVMINGEASSRIIPAAMTGRSQLAAAFTALDESDQYDAVLTGLCAKILDNDQAATAASLEDSAALLTEMNQRNIPASPRSLMSLIDATVKTQDTTTMTDILRLARQNKAGLNQYGILQSDIVDMPAGNQQVACADGSRKTRAERLESLPDVPVDDRGTEIASAMATLGVVGICFLANLFGMDDITPVTNLLWFTITTVGVVDNFYDVLQFGSNAAISSLNTTDTNKENLKLPQKESLPFGLGTGELTGTVTRGLTRLCSTDTERECQVEAAALYTAYVLGLPCFAFRPNSLEAANLMVQHEEQNLLSTTSGILKVLIWLMAPVAMESMKHPQLICSDPREASGLLQRLQDYAGKNNLDSLWWMLEESPEQETQDLLKWAYHEADVLIRNNLKDVTEMSQRLTGGAATIGDCVAVVERW